jgi:hypothetical protein
MSVVAMRAQDVEVAVVVVPRLGPAGILFVVNAQGGAVSLLGAALVAAVVMLAQDVAAFALPARVFEGEVVCGCHIRLSVDDETVRIIDMRNLQTQERKSGVMVSNGLQRTVTDGNGR